ncbi:hypothetical protein [Shewanella japonica]|uniref:hypothetical protein n=1 Tax=Shewanella japonica TaxID=93973 RepID=UPI00249459B1|nr:hypothetical protein [Shewanella japonica]
MAKSSNEQSELSKLAPASVASINKGKNEVTVLGSDGNGTPAKVIVSLPIGLENNPLLKLYLGYLKSPLFLALASSTRYTKAIAIRNFTNYVASCQQYIEQGLPYDVVNQYFINIKLNSNRTSFYNDELILKVPIDLALSRESKLDSRYYNSKLNDYLIRFPNFPPPKSNAKKSMASIFGKADCPYTDTELLQSMRLYCCTLILKFFEIRDYFLSIDSIKDELERLKDEKYQSKPLLCHRQAKNYTLDSAPSSQISEEHWLKLKTINHDIFKAVLDSDDPFIISWFSFNSFPSPKANTNEANLTNTEWVKQFYFNNQIRKSLKIKKNEYRLRRLDNISPNLLLVPTDFEIFLIQCLLASESIQRGGLLKHKIANFSEIIDSVQAGYSKSRRGKTSATAIYTRQSLPYECYTKFINIREKESSLNLEDTELTLNFSNKGTSKGHIGFTNKSLHFFKLLISDSGVSDFLNSELGEEGAPFRWLIEKIWKHNQLAYNETLQNNIKKKITGAKPGYARRNNLVVGLTPDAISMSRKRIDDHVVIKPKEHDESDINKESTTEFNNAHVSSELTAHNPTTKQNIYKNRSNSKESIESEKNFGAQVGDKMVNEASKLNDALKDVELVTLEKVRDILGIKDNESKVEALLQQVNADLWGGFNHEGKVTIITSEVTAMLLSGYIAHIKSELPKLFLDSSLRGQEAQKKIAYLAAILDKFPVHLQRKGEQQLQEYDIPYPSLI